MSSTSAAGVSIVTLQFTLGLTLDVAEQEVQAAINAGGSLLPADLPAPPVYAKVNPADAPVLTLAISSDTLPLTEVQNLVNTRLAQKISQVSRRRPGVAGRRPAAGGADPGRHAGARVVRHRPRHLRTAITSANANSAKGSFDGPKRAYTINANDQLLTVDDYRNLIVAYKNGAPVRLIERRARRRERREHPARRLGRQAHGAAAPGDHPERAAPAGRERDRDGRRDQEAAARAAGRAAGQRCSVEVLADRTTGIRASVEHVEIELCSRS